MSTAAWEAIFMLVVLKIPIVYLCVVVWWAVRAEPRPLEGALRPVRPPEPPDRYWRPRPPGGLRRGPRGGPVRRYARSTPAESLARARMRR